MEFSIEKYQLKSMSFYDMLTADEASYVRSHAERREYRKGQVLIREGAFSKGIFIMRKGKVKIHNANPEGKESIIYIYKKDEFFGYRPMVACEPNPVSATAMDHVVTTFIPKSVFNEVLETSPVFAKKLLVSITSEFTVWINKVSLFSQHGVKERVALALLILLKVYRNAPPGKKFSRGTIDIGRDDLAAYIGTAKETVVRMLRVFKDAGVISSRGTKITVLKPDVLLDHLRFF